MIDKDVLSCLKSVVKEELDREANKTIDKLCDDFRSELGKHKNKLVVEMLNNIDIELKRDEIKQEAVFQINIKGGLSDDR